MNQNRGVAGKARGKREITFFIEEFCAMSGLCM